MVGPKKPDSETGLPAVKLPEKDKESPPKTVTKRGLWMRANWIVGHEMPYGKKGRPHWRARRDEIYRELLKKANL